ncbi:cation:proton antiporter [Pedobacter glucosidilyticus]|uniref:cation:proton antiporter n=1 Tax=Pedobacter glucosidilyticus TaxID=1122941 RepID=UPI000401C1F0|nr:cation:proton antiporter [Pedobacter glucosidilyticus]
MNIDFFEHLIHEFELPLQNPVLIFSLILFIILLSPILLRRLKIPGTIGLILSGVVIGPHGVNLLAKNSAVDLFSTIGLLYIMFIAGIELDMNEFKKNQFKSLGFGFFTFIIPIALGLPACYYILGYDLNASLLIASMFATHTLVAYPIVTKFGVTKNPAVAITVGGTILTDTAVLIILAIIVGSANGGLTTQFWMKLGISLTIFLLIIFLILPRIAKWFFNRMDGDKTSNYVFVLSLVFLSAFLAEVAGVEPIIGAFMAGLALNRLIPHSSALMNRLEFVGNAIFIPFFLISVGMLVDIRVILSGYTAIFVAATLSIVALAGKWVAAFITQITFKYKAEQRQLIFGLSSAHAAATLAVILVGYKANILDENILNGTIILILVTCVVASFATEAAVKKIVQNQDNPDFKEEPEEVVNYENILIPVSNFNKLEPIVDFTILIKDKKSPYPLNILSIVSNDSDAETNIVQVKRKLEDFVKYASATETLVNPIATIDINISDGITRISKEILASTLILGWPHKETFLDKIFGPKSEAIINATTKTIFFCDFVKPLNTSKKIVLVCPPLTELEDGFSYWMDRILKLANELSVMIDFHAAAETQNAIIKYTKIVKSKTAYSLSLLNFDEYPQLLSNAPFDHLMIFVSARKGSISYHSMLDNLNSTLNKDINDHNILLIYPSVKTSDNKYTEYSDMNAELFIKGVQKVNKIKKGIKTIFKK